MCTFFYYNGCNGTEDYGNRFTHISQCQEICQSTRLTTRQMMDRSELGQTTSKILLKKPGFCPGSNNLCLKIQESMIKCESDVDCHEYLKCCACESNKSLISICIEPLSCMATKYGCCADGKTLATDELHSNCSPYGAHIESAFVEVISNDLDEELLLNCEVSGDPRPNITWIYLGNNTQIFIVESQWDLIQPLWLGVIKIPTALYSQDLWSCQTVNAGGWDEIEVNVHSSKFNDGFLQVFAIGKDDVVINATLNTKVVLHCPIYGIPRPIITWFYNRVPVNQSFQLISIFSRHLQIHNVKLIHDGLWTCNGGNPMKNISYDIKLKVYEPIKIFPPPMGTRTKANYGQRILLFCDVRIQGIRWINWFWEVDKKMFPINTTMDGDQRVLIISSFRNNQFIGSFVCEAHNSISMDIVKFPIVPYNDEEDILVNPSGTLFVGMTITLICPTKSTENQIQVQWKKHDILLDVTSPELILVLKSKLDSGFYSCQYRGGSYATYLYILDKYLDL